MTAAIRLYRLLLQLLQPEYWLVRRFVAEMVADPLSKLPVVDVGGGRAPHGRALYQARPRAPQIVVDLTPAPELSLVADAARLPIASDTAGVVAMFQVLQHVEAPSVVLAEIRRVLAPQGALLITYPSMLPQGASRDLWRWTHAGAERLLADAGFTILHHRPLGGFFFLLTANAAALPGRLLIRHESGWRSGRRASDYLRVGLALLLAAPWHILGYPALALDRLRPAKSYQTGGLLLARRTDHG
ncbi:MAG: class I SAM-dependent methyltransferase [Alphaproteobacteria bacterium]|jgi:SAM-dependent methyltransferase|nr:class I SAM-dependent methyltransferase [Alphaproteobacteria bacterium]